MVSDSISTFKSNAYGQKSLNLASDGYHSLVTPILPYAQGPYSYVSPYVAKADEIADISLNKVDQTFPIVKQDAEQMKTTVLDLAFMPLRLAFHGKDYVMGTYGKEYKKCGGDGILAGGKAVITTGLVVTSDTLTWLSEYLSQKKEEGKGFVKEKTKQ